LIRNNSAYFRRVMYVHVRSRLVLLLKLSNTVHRRRNKSLGCVWFDFWLLTFAP
jgi:hypothetical protein